MDDGKIELKQRARKEKARIKRLLKQAKTPPEKMKMLEPVIDNVSWMKAKLEDTTEQIKEGQIAIEYNNGGGQKGIRESPLFKGYEALFKTYMSGMSKIMEAMPAKDSAPEPPADVKPSTVLDAILAEYKE
jgi:hypothetical protein